MKTMLAVALSVFALSAQAEVTADQVQAKVQQIYGEDCYGEELYRDMGTTEGHSVKVTDAEGFTESFVLWEAFCFAGAYNFVSVFFLVDGQDNIKPVTFSQPVVDVSYVNDDFEGAVKSLKVTGISSTPFVVNAEYDPNTQSLTSLNLWRGIGDASSMGTWAFGQIGSNYGFSLKHYEVDASYDGEMNPTTVISF